jgi:hypothetical protein
MRSIKFLVATSIVVGLLGAQPTAFGALTYLVTVDTSSISGQSGWMDMQFNPGGLPIVTGSATVSQFFTDGTLNPASIVLTGGSIGDVSPPTSLVQLNNSTGLNDYFESIVFGSTLSFHVTLDGDILTPPIGTLAGTSFSLSFYDSAITQSLLNDPGDFTGSAARIDVLFDGTIDLLPSTSAASITLVPEPASLGLLAAGAAMMMLRRRSRQQIGVTVMRPDVL